jgi:hypothetical protein
MITVTVDYNRLHVIKKATDETGKIIRTVLRNQAKSLVGKIQYAIRTQYKERSRALVKSVKFDYENFDSHSGKVVVSVGEGLVYAHTQLGPPTQRKTIRAKDGEYLAIPVDEAAWRLQQTVSSLWQLKNLRRIKNVIGVPSGKGRVVPRFVLQRSVVIVPRVDPVGIGRDAAPMYKSQLKERIMERFS